MKVVCVVKDGVEYLTIGKVYDVYHQYQGYSNGQGYHDFVLQSPKLVTQITTLINDIGIRSEYDSSRFITLEEYRNNKLTTLGI